MQRITTSSRVIDKFGVGKDGFGIGPPQATQLEAPWFDSVQEEIARVIEGQGIVLDGTLEQLKTALDNYAFIGDIGISSGGSLTIESGGALTIEAGATVVVEEGVAFDLLGDVTIGDSAGDILIVNSTSGFTGPVTINALLTMTANVDIGANTLTATGGTITAPGGTVSASNGMFSNLDTGVWTPDTLVVGAATDGNIQYDGRKLTVGDGSNAAEVQSPVLSYIKSVSTVNADDDTGASVTRTILPSEFVYIRVSALQNVTVDGATPLLRIRAENGVDPVVIVVNSAEADPGQSFLPISVAVDEERPNGFVVKWKPDTDTPVPGNNLWTISVRHGYSGPAANQTDTRNLLLEVTYA